VPAIIVAPDGIPPRLVRGFKEESHAQTFLAGDVRLQIQSFYQTIEDAKRKDSEEGEARLIVPGVGGTDVNYGGSFHNPVYLLCCSDPAVGGAGFGPWFVGINAPGTLLRALGDAASPIPGRTLDEVRLLRVRYSKGARVADAPHSGERFQLMLAQKPESYAHECEWRYVVTFSGPVAGAPDPIRLRVDDMSAIATVMPRPVPKAT
jgi:hypothetical protein